MLIRCPPFVARLIAAGKLAGFHFNDSKYGDDDLDHDDGHDEFVDLNHPHVDFDDQYKYEHQLNFFEFEH